MRPRGGYRPGPTLKPVPGIRWLQLCILAALLAACEPPQGAPSDDATGSDRSDRPTAPEGGYPVHVVDDAGLDHTFESAPRRIVSLVPSATETLLALGLHEHIVGRTDFDVMPELADLPSVGGGLAANLEILISLNLDLVVRFAGESDRGTVDRMTELGIPHFAIRPDGIEDVRAIIGRLGRITGSDRAADSLLADIDAALDLVARRVQGRPVRNVVYLLGGEPPWVAGPDTYISELIVAGGGANVFADLDRLYSPVSLEELIVRDIDLILTSEGVAVPPELADVPVERLPASVEVPGPGLAAAAWAVARLIHPETGR